MRARLTAALSLTGVLAAGSAAALVNTKVLTSQAGRAQEPVTPAVAPADTATPSTSAPLEPARTQAAYQIGDAGVVVLDTAGGALALVSADPSDGWLVVASEQEDATHLEVVFQSNLNLVTFRANLLFGVVSTSVESSTVGADDEGDSDDDTTSVPGGEGGEGDDGAPAVSSSPPVAGTTPQTAAPRTTVDDHDDDHDDDDHDDDHDDD